jgi:hypothetical protein
MRRSRRQTRVVSLAGELGGAKFGRNQLLAEAGAAIAADIDPGLNQSLEKVENEMIVTAQPKNMPGEKDRRTGPPLGDRTGVPGVGKFVEEFASEFADLAAKE